MRFAIIIDGVVINVCMALAPLAENWVQSDTAGIGDLYADGVFTTPTLEPV